MKDFFINIIIWFYDHPIITTLMLFAIYFLIVGKYLDKPAGEVPAWVFLFD